MKRLPPGRYTKNLTSSSSRLLSSSSKSSSSQKALDEVKTLCENKLYKDALVRIEKVELEYPSCSKALTYYRGLARYEIAKEEGNLPSLSHMKD
ncbi:MAG: hypothetical protein K2X50_03770 [Gammaproteobacteria bacterium]|nr:hypothetical protein [Gammaproteobacteria bacterium]